MSCRAKPFSVFSSVISEMAASEGDPYMRSLQDPTTPMGAGPSPASGMEPALRQPEQEGGKPWQKKGGFMATAIKPTAEGKGYCDRRWRSPG